MSVRLRLTLAVSMIVALLSLGSALIGPSYVEDALVDDVIETELALLDDFFETGLDDDFITSIIPLDADGSFVEVITNGDVVILTDEEGFVVEVPREEFEAGLLDPVEFGLPSFDDIVFEDIPFDDTPFGLVTTQQQADEFADALIQSGRFDDLLRRSGTGAVVVATGGDLFIRMAIGESAEFFAADPREVGQPVVSFNDAAELAYGFAELQSTTLSQGPVADDAILFGQGEVDGVEVIVLASAAAISTTVSRVSGVLWVAVPVLAFAAALVTRLLAGRALRPVKAITDQTATISGGNLDERVPVPNSSDEIATLASTMNGMLDRLETDDKRRRQFVSDASHELRSPVAVMKSEAEVALRAPELTDVNELASGMLDESTRMATIIDDLLALARHDEGVPAPTTEVDLDDIVFSETGRSRRVPIDASKVSAGRVTGRPDELARAVSHLLDNGARHAESKVVVGLATAKGRVHLTVDDDGPGVSQEDRAAIFERFTRLDAARTRDNGGAGLGLAVVTGVVQRSGGTVTVGDSKLGGARFLVDLPLAD